MNSPQPPRMSEATRVLLAILLAAAVVVGLGVTYQARTQTGMFTPVTSSSPLPVSAPGNGDVTEPAPSAPAPSLPAGATEPAATPERYVDPLDGAYEGLPPQPGEKGYEAPATRLKTSGETQREWLEDQGVIPTTPRTATQQTEEKEITVEPKAITRQQATEEQDQTSQEEGTEERGAGYDVRAGEPKRVQPAEDTPAPTPSASTDE